MYYHLYFYVIPKEKRDFFLKNLDQVRKNYESFGALEGERLYLATDAYPKYGCAGLANLLSPGKDDDIWMGLIKFESAEQAEQVLNKLDADPTASQLYNEFVANFPVNRVVRCEFEGPVE
jgi:hypothetical protein